MVARLFDHVAFWVFDLDNTLYPPAARLFDQIEVRMTDWVMETLRVDRTEADRLRRHYWRTYGTTLAGLMAEHGVDPGPYLTHVHEIDLGRLEPDRALAEGHPAPARAQDRLHQRQRALCRTGDRRARARGPVRRGLRGRARGLPPQARARRLRGDLHRRRARCRPRRDVRGRRPQPRRAPRDGDAHHPCGARARGSPPHPPPHGRPVGLPRPAWARA
jgi:hypothetical protein